ncbi:nucleoside hydrolase [Lentzea tibetensis]|uniref:Nucleoside hydrolase n=1 Tax=Lentzea tibetensis TaxID=2591470 RepID=A0A563F2E9_9PSEU|nr:nucleoside hydrolase [Lentzea tibetensis]TWP53534.1 nucleoside hydrolase [Lentzea tibetensis]
MAIPLIIDTDPGVDDAFALALAARSPEVDLIGVTTVFGNVDLDHTTRNARRLLKFLGHDAPVARGEAHPRGERKKRDAGDVHGDDGLSGLAHTLPEPTRPLDERDAVTFLRDTIEGTDARVTVAAIGPLTNIAKLIEDHPATASRIGRLVVMGGGLDEGNVTSTAEFNLWSDPEAAKTVLAKANPTLVTIDLTRRCAVYADWLDLVGESGLGKILVGFAKQYREYFKGRTGKDGIVVHDAVAVAEAIVPGILETKTYHLTTDDEGALKEGPHEIDVATGTDLDALREFLKDRLMRP